MKKVKNLFSLVLTLIMVLSMTMTAFAASTGGEHKLTVTSEKEGHIFEAYQVFSGVYSNSDGIGKLSDIQWGSGVKYADLLHDLANNADLKEGETALFRENMSAKEVADVLSKLTTAQIEIFSDLVGANRAIFFESTEMDKPSIVEGKISYTFEDLPDGYYFVKDRDGSLAGKEGDSYTAFMLQVVGDVTTAAKTELPTVDKSITGERGDDFNIGNSETSKADEVEIGDLVEYTLKGTIPTQASEYNYYFFYFTDTLSEGLTFQLKKGDDAYQDFAPTEEGFQALPNSSVTATADGEQINVTVDVKKVGTDTVIAIYVPDAKSHAGSEIVVKYYARLNEKAKIGIEGNPNKVKLEYSNNPDHNYKQGNNGRPAAEDTDAFGKTPETTVYTYTTGILIHKIDQDGNILQGAGFQITGTDLNIVLVASDEYVPATPEQLSDSNIPKFYKLQDNTYTSQAPTEDTYRETDKNATAGYVHEGDVYRELTADDIAKNSDDDPNNDVTIYILVKGNKDKYVNPEDGAKYVLVQTFVQKQNEGKNVNIKAMVDALGNVYFYGLGSGTYTISEYETPKGYNTIQPFDINISWQAPNPETDPTKCTWKATINGQSDGLSINDNGVISFNVENKSGNVLPETGGIGTTIFYTVGAILVIGAIVLLITKKRMSKED